MRLKYPSAHRRKRMEIAVGGPIFYYDILAGGVGQSMRVLGTGLSPVDAWRAAEDRMLADELDKALTQ